VASPTFVQEYEDTWTGTTSPKTISVTVANGDTLVIFAVAESNISLSTPSGGGLTYTLRQAVSVTNFCSLSVWTAPSSSAQTFTLSMSNTSGSQVWGFNCLRFSGASSVGASSKTNSTGAPSLALTTTGANSTIVTFVGDFSASDGTTRTWRTINGITPASGGLEKTYFRDAAKYTVYGAYWNDAGAAGSKTTGISSPSAMTYSIASVELLGSGPNAGSSAVALQVGVAASGARKSQGSAAVADNVGIAATGSRKSQGTAALNVTVGVAGVGHQPPSRGSSALGLTVGVTATGSRKSKGSAAVADTVGIAATGATKSVGSAAVANSVIISATGAARVLPIRILTPTEILTGNRNTTFYLETLDANDSPLARLDGVTGGKLDWVSNAMIKGGGDLTVVDVDQPIDWLTARIRPVMLIEGLPPQPLGVFVAAEAPDSFGNGRSWAVKLLAKETILDQDQVAETYALAAGTVTTTAIIALITSSGITNYAVTPSAKTLDGDMVWSPGTSKLRIINDLLETINYFSLYSNPVGQMVAEPYVVPAQRPIIYEFIDGPGSIFLPDFTRDVDIWGIPNRVILIGTGDGTTEALVSAPADNTNPASPYSIANRGRVISHTETGIEASDQTSLDNLARSRLIQLTTPTDGIPISHAPVPGLAVNQAVHFRRVPAGIDDRRVISKTSITLDGTALAVSTLTQVVDL
jgi:hypothetical protein